MYCKASAIVKPGLLKSNATTMMSAFGAIPSYLFTEYPFPAAIPVLFVPCP